MPKAYFIGGPPRVGKSTLSLEVLKTHPMLATSTDALRYMLQGALPRDVAPRLHQAGWVPYEDETKKLLLNDPEKVILIQNEESEYLLPYVKRFVWEYLQDKKDVLVEGVHLTPKLLKTLDYDYEAVILGNTSDDHAVSILKAARANAHDWLAEFDDDIIMAYGRFIKLFSIDLKRQCEEMGLKYVEISDQKFFEDIKTTVHELII